MRSAFAIMVPGVLRKSSSNLKSQGSSSSLGGIDGAERLSQPGFSDKAAANPKFLSISEEEQGTVPMRDEEDTPDAAMSRPMRELNADQWVTRNGLADVDDKIDALVPAPISFEIAGVGRKENDFINARVRSAERAIKPVVSSEAIGEQKDAMRQAMGKGEYSRVLELAQRIAGELARLGSTTEALEYYFIALSYSTRDGLPKCYRDIFETMGDSNATSSGRVNSGQRNQFMTISEAIRT
jgi:hypothetical protein